MAFGLLEGIALAGTLLNAMQGAKAQSAANKAMAPQKALDLERLKALREIMRLAEGYDPMAEASAAEAHAKDAASQTLAQTLAKLAATYTQGGGVPGLSSAYQVSVQRAVDNVLGPLAAQLAQLRAGATEKKMQAYALAAGTAPGQLASSQFAQQYLQQAGGYGQATGLGLMQLAQMLAPKVVQAAAPQSPAPSSVPPQMPPSVNPAALYGGWPPTTIPVSL